MYISPLSVTRNLNSIGPIWKVTRPFIADIIARFSADDQSISKQLSAYLALRFKDELRFLAKFGLWVYRDPALGRWREAKDEPLKAAKQVCEEAVQSIGRAQLTTTDALARNVVRLAELEPLFRQPVEFEPARGRGRT